MMQNYNNLDLGHESEQILDLVGRNFWFFIDKLNETYIADDIKSFISQEADSEFISRVLSKLAESLSKNIEPLLSNSNDDSTVDIDMETLFPALKIYLEILTAFNQRIPANASEGRYNIDFGCFQKMMLCVAQYLGRTRGILSATKSKVIKIAAGILNPPFISKATFSMSNSLLTQIISEMLDNPPLLRFYTQIFILLPHYFVQRACEDLVREIKTRLESAASLTSISLEILEFLFLVCLDSKFQQAIIDEKIYEVLCDHLIHFYISSSFIEAEQRNRSLIVQILLNSLSGMEETDAASFVDKVYTIFWKLIFHNQKLAFRDEVLFPIIHGASLSNYIPFTFRFSSLPKFDGEKTCSDSFDEIKQQALAKEVQIHYYGSEGINSYSPAFHIEWEEVEDMEKADIKKADCALMLISCSINGELIQFVIYLNSGSAITSSSPFNRKDDEETNLLFYLDGDGKLNFLSNKIQIKRQHQKDIYACLQDIILVLHESTVLLTIRDFSELRVNLHSIGSLCPQEKEWKNDDTKLFRKTGLSLKTWVGYHSFKIENLYKLHSIYSPSHSASMIVQNLRGLDNNQVYFGRKDTTLKNLIEMVFPDPSIHQSLQVLSFEEPIDLNQTLGTIFFAMQNKYSGKLIGLIELTMKSMENVNGLKSNMRSPEDVFLRQITPEQNVVLRSIDSHHPLMSFKDFNYSPNTSYTPQKVAQLVLEFELFKEVMLDIFFGEENLGEEKLSTLFLHSVLSGFTTKRTLKLIFNSILREMSLRNSPDPDSKSIQKFLKKALNIVFDHKAYFFSQKIDKLEDYLKKAFNLGLASTPIFLNAFSRELLWKGSVFEDQEEIIESIIEECFLTNKSIQKLKEDLVY